MIQSALYLGDVRHRRHAPAENAFRYSVAYFYIDLAEAPGLFRLPGIFSRGPGLFAFRREDYLGGADGPLDGCVRDRVEEATGRRPAGPVRLLTQIRYFGFCFNPVSFYYCFDTAGERVEFILAEITNTPWNERHAYVLECKPGGGTQTFAFPKAFHVSPFMAMDLGYRWAFSAPGERLVAHMDNLDRGGRAFFDATLSLRRLPWSARNVAAVLALHPFMTFKTVFLIHLQALKLWSKGVPFHVHPAKAKGVSR